MQGYFKNCFFQTAFPPHALIHSYRTCGSRDGTHQWAGSWVTNTNRNQYAHWMWSFMNSAGLTESAKSLNFLSESMGADNIQQKLWSSWDQAVSPSPAAKAQGRWFIVQVRMLTHWWFTMALKICCLYQWWMEWKALCVKRHEKVATGLVEHVMWPRKINNAKSAVYLSFSPHWKEIYAYF